MVYISHVCKLFFTVLPHFRTNNCERPLAVPIYPNRSKVIRTSVQTSEPHKGLFTSHNCPFKLQTIWADNCTGSQSHSRRPFIITLFLRISYLLSLLFFYSSLCYMKINEIFGDFSFYQMP
jgi:hypothetical protein